MPIHVHDAATDRLAPRLADTSGSGADGGAIGRRSNMSSSDSMRPCRPASASPRFHAMEPNGEIKRHRKAAVQGRKGECGCSQHEGA